MNFSLNFLSLSTCSIPDMSLGTRPLLSAKWLGSMCNTNRYEQFSKLCQLDRSRVRCELTSGLPMSCCPVRCSTGSYIAKWSIMEYLLLLQCSMVIRIQYRISLRNYHQHFVPGANVGQENSRIETRRQGWGPRMAVTQGTQGSGSGLNLLSRWDLESQNWI